MNVDVDVDVDGVNANAVLIYRRLALFVLLSRGYTPTNKCVITNKRSYVAKA
jgi:hypothetical protein